MNNWYSSWGNATPNPASTPSLDNAWDAKGQDDVLMEWQRLKEVLASAKEAEMEFRKYVVKRAFPQADEGTNTLELGNGYQLKAGIKYNYNLADNATVEACLAEISKIGNEGSFIADRLVSWTPNFLLTEYRKIEEDASKDDKTAKEILKHITKMLTITDAAPTLEIKEPKGKKK